VACAPPFYARRIVLKRIKKSQFAEYHKITVIESGTFEEIYPFTGQKMIRPKVHLELVIPLTLLVIALVGLACWGILELLALFDWYQDFSMPWWLQFLLLYALSACLTLLLCAKWIVIYCIRLYQRFACYEVRSKCVFIPNCSEYMILAIKKYGLIKGIKKGKDRFKRCKEPNGGEDYP